MGPWLSQRCAGRWASCRTDPWTWSDSWLGMRRPPRGSRGTGCTRLRRHGASAAHARRTEWAFTPSFARLQRGRLRCLYNAMTGSRGSQWRSALAARVLLRVHAAYPSATHSRCMVRFVGRFHACAEVPGVLDPAKQIVVRDDAPTIQHVCKSEWLFSYSVDMAHGGHQPGPEQLDAQFAGVIAETMQALATPSRVLILGRLRAGGCSG